MLKIDSAQIKVDINLNNGIYHFDCESATGKTRLYYVLKDYQLLGEPVVAYSYEDYLNGVKLDDKINSNTKLILIDRYDMFKGEYVDLLLKNEKACIVLIDSKETLDFCEYDSVCGINMTKESIEVFG